MSSPISLLRRKSTGEAITPWTLVCQDCHLLAVLVPTGRTLSQPGRPFVLILTPIVARGPSVRRSPFTESGHDQGVFPSARDSCIDRSSRSPCTRGGCPADHPGTREGGRSRGAGDRRGGGPRRPPPGAGQVRRGRGPGPRGGGPRGAGVRPESLAGVRRRPAAETGRGRERRAGGPAAAAGRGAGAEAQARGLEGSKPAEAEKLALLRGGGICRSPRRAGAGTRPGLALGRPNPAGDERRQGGRGSESESAGDPAPGPARGPPRHRPELEQLGGRAGRAAGLCGGAGEPRAGPGHPPQGPASGPP